MQATYITGHGFNRRYHVRPRTHPDVTVRCGAHDHDVHKDVISSQSSFFNICCYGDFKETHTGIIDLSEDDADTVARMLCFMYTHKYNDGNSRVARSNDLMMNNALVYAIGEKYNLEPLKQLAVTKFSAYTDQVRPWIDEFASVVRFIYETTHADGDALRDLVVKACSPHFKDIMSSRNWREIMVDFGDFGLGIADAARKHYEEGPERTDIQIQLWDLSSITSRAAALGAGSPHCIECLETLEEKINKASGSLWTM